MPSPAPPRRGRILRALFNVAILIALIGAMGAGYQAYAVRGEVEKFPAPGKLIDIGGLQLHLVCIGQGSPTVIFESSGFGSAVSFNDARTDIAKRTRVCSYDRRGMGWSDPGPSGPLTFNQLVDDLDKLLARAALPPPYVMVASSIGGLTTEMFARKHPDQIAGLVFLDAANSVALERIMPKIAAYWPEVMCLAKPAATVGLVRILDPLGLRPHREEMAISRLYRPEPMQTMCGLVRGAAKSLEEFKIAPPLPRDMPMTVLTAGAPRAMLPLGIMLVDPQETREAQKEFAATSGKGTWRIVERSDHLIADHQPGVVVAAVMEMIAATATRQPLSVKRVLLHPVEAARHQ